MPRQSKPRVIKTTTNTTTVRYGTTGTTVRTTVRRPR